MPGDGSTPTVHLVDQAGRDVEPTPSEVARRLEAEEFFWIDVESPDSHDLDVFSQSLRLPSGVVAGHLRADARSSFTLRRDCVVAVLPAAVGTEASAWLDANYVTVVLTERFLLTAHSAPCSPLHHAHEQYLALTDEERSHQVRILFLVLDDLTDSFRPQLLAIDDRLGEVQLGMLDGASPQVHDELVKILGLLTDGIQEFGWYIHDLDEITGTVNRLPGQQSDAQDQLTGHHRHVARMRENGREIREEAKDALRQYSEVVAGRQARVLSSLTIVATVFLPLSFLTGYFGMNFTTLTGHVQTGLWEFILLGLLLPVASAALSLLLIRRLERRFGLGGFDPPSG